MASLGQKLKKYSVETKKKILDSYYSYSHSVLELSKMYEIPHKTIENWITKTNNGINILDVKKRQEDLKGSLITKKDMRYQKKWKNF